MGLTEDRPQQKDESMNLKTCQQKSIQSVTQEDKKAKNTWGLWNNIKELGNIYVIQVPEEEKTESGPELFQEIIGKIFPNW